MADSGNDEEVRREARRLLEARESTLQDLLPYLDRLTAPDDRTLQEHLFAKCQERLLASAAVVLGDAAASATAMAELALALKQLVGRLKGSFEFKKACELLGMVCARNIEHPGKPLDVWCRQQLALCTYKDEELPPEKRYHEALALLDALGLRDPGCTNTETLGLGGAVYKRKWETSGQLEYLRTALHFYRKGWRSNPGQDMGYCGCNAAYILDVLAFHAQCEARREQTDAAAAQTHGRDARSLRQEMRDKLQSLVPAGSDHAKSYWHTVTMAEICWGLDDWDAAGEWLARANRSSTDEWERQTTVRQLVSMAAMKGILPPPDEKQPVDWHPAWRALHKLLGADTRAALECHRGKVGLALSGGGFRASFFHLGVLARLAECNVLRSVEVLSTVSGGSIIGAHYYLELRALLRERTDAAILRKDYIALVRRVMDDFLAGVQMNLRVRVLANLFHNLCMIFRWTGYTRSNRLGELYAKHLYARVKDGHWAAITRRMKDILVCPLVRDASAGQREQHDDNFKPKFSNWRRRAKVPILLLNTTSLNSGHNWHFTATWMGEPPGLLGAEVDMNERHRRLYYHEAPTALLRDYPLGYAVAASSCVPALFDPLELKGLYPGRTVRLVDGGVHDNQGVAGLLDESCKLILCSDASGQLDDQRAPKDSMLSVFYRSDSILQGRVRDAQYQDLRARAEGHALQGLFFIHLKQELETVPISWIGCKEELQERSGSTATTYGVDREIQRLLSEIRTDLDTFTEVEAYALMASGYLMTSRQLAVLDEDHKQSDPSSTWGDFMPAADTYQETLGKDYWPFMPLVQILGKAPWSSDARRHDLAVQLRASKALFGKVFVLRPELCALTFALGLAAGLAAVAWLVDNWNEPVLRTVFVHQVAIAAGLLIGGIVWPVIKFADPTSAGRSMLVKAGLATFGWVATWIHLLIFDPIFKARGSLARLMKLPPD